MITWAYVAGFTDGEGNIGARNRKVALFQKEPEVLIAIKAFLDSEGVISTLHRRKDRTHNNLGYILEQHQLVISDRPSVEKFLLSIRPYSVVKKQLVEDVWRYCKLFRRLSNKVTGGLSRITDKHVSRRSAGRASV